MRRRRLGTVSAIFLAVLAWLALATPAAACSCLETTVADYVGADSDWMIFTGTALEARDLDVPFVVDEWFQGSPPRPAVLLTTGQERMPDGVISADTCGRTLQPGPWLVFALPEGDGRLDPGNCSITAALDDPDGQRLLGDVRARLTGRPPPSLEPTPAPRDASGAPGADSGVLLYVAAPVAVGVLLFAVLVVLARRRAR